MMASKPELEWVRPPRQARSQETLDRILDAAEALVAEKGFEDTPVAEIAQRAGSSVGAFYARFHDKDGLLHALYERYYEQAIATADAALDPARWEGARIAELIPRGHALPGVDLSASARGLMRAFVAAQPHATRSSRRASERLSHHVIARLSRARCSRAATRSRTPSPSARPRFGLTLVFSALESLILFGEMRSVAARALRRRPRRPS